MEYASQYDVTKIAVINIKDLDGVKNAIQVISNHPEESKIFQCISATIKNEWIEKFEKALKFNRMKRKQNLQVSKNMASRSNKQTSTDSNVSKLTTKMSHCESTMSESDDANKNHAPEWLLRVHEEIHTLIAQRHFEDALGLITRCEEYFTKESSFQNANEIIQKVISMERVFSIK